MLTTRLLPLALAAGVLAPAAPAQNLSASLLQGGLSNPLYAISPKGDFRRLFIIEQNSGLVRIYDFSVPGLLATPFLNIGSLISSGGERGLLGIAFDPDFLTNGQFYVAYTNTSGASRVARYSVVGDPVTTDVADPGTADIVVAYNQPFSNHNGGWIGFGPDGYLYVATGDGGSGGDPGDRASNPNVILGKMLRLDMSGDSLPTDTLNDYLIPSDNPFAGGGGLGEIWQLGLRNPWRCAFDRETGDFWIADVGQSAREEVNFVPAGQGNGWNFGWKCKEGSITFGTSSFCVATDPNLKNPVAEYTHGLGCSISGGFPFRGGVPGLRGKFVYADYCSSRIWLATLSSTTAATAAEIQTTLAIPGSESIVGFGEDELGNVYICDASGGEIWRIDGSEVVGTPYCFANGSGTACPCGNNVLPGSAAGCRNETGTGGALWASGVPSVSNDTLTFNMNGGSSSSFGLLFSGANQLNGGLGVVAFDGLRCMGGGLIRHGSRALNALGANIVAWGQGAIVAQGSYVSGQTRNFQVFYRSSLTGGCMTGVNTTNAVSISFIN